MSGSPLEVRRLTPADAAALHALRHRALITDPWSFGSSPGDDRLQTVEDARVSLSIEPSQAAYFGGFAPPVALAPAPSSAARSDAGSSGDSAAELAAIARLGFNHRTKFAHRAEVTGVYTAPEHRGRGLARAVMAALLDHARAHGIAVVGLSASERAPEAIALYESLGFTRWGLEPDAMRIDNEPAAEVYLQLSL